jgi:hypothetical protein
LSCLQALIFLECHTREIKIFAQSDLQVGIGIWPCYLFSLKALPDPGQHIAFISLK